MSKKTKIGKIKKNIFFVLAAMEIFLVNTPFVLAKGGGFSVPSPSGVASQLENRYHLNLQSIQDFGEGFNVANTKGQAPSVMIFFSPANPKEGEKITATALPTFFQNQKENLYFTWYLKHQGGNTDWNSDGSKDIEDYKIEAMRLAANGGWEPNYDVNGNGVVDLGECSSVADWYTNCAPVGDPDNDGYDIWNSVNKQGGVDREDMPKHCYFHDFSTGKSYELAKFSTSPNSSQTAQCATGTLGCGLTSTEYTSTFGGTSAGSFSQDLGTGAGTFSDSFTGSPTGSNTDQCISTGSTPTCSQGIVECAKGEPVCGASGSNISITSGCGDLSTPTCSGVGSASVTCDISTVNGKDYEHLFANPGDTGNNSFGPTEEELFGTDPNDPDTDDDGMNDEADAAGVGQDAFSWIYQEGDRVGVAVEGTSMTSTKYNDGSMMIMWAFLGNNCDKGTTGTYSPSIKGYNVNIPITGKNLNNCVINNFVDPSVSGQDKKLDISLSYSPDYPVNDPSGDEMGDLVSISSTMDSTAGDSYQIYYDWKVSIKNQNTGNWDTVTAPDLGDIKLKGINIDTLNFPLNLLEKLDLIKFPNKKAFPASTYFPGGIGYIKVKLEARESSPTGTRKGRAEAQIKVTSTEEKIQAFLVDASGGASINLLNESVDSDGDGHDDGEICYQDILKKSVCFVTKNEIIGMRIKKSIGGGATLQQINWKLDGKPYPCDDTNMNCGSVGGYFKNYFPVTKSVGEYYTVVANALDIVNGQTIELVRTFRVVDPFVEIISRDYDIAWPKLLGIYTNLDGTEEQNFSKTIMQTIEGSAIELKAVFHPSWIQDSNKMPLTEWVLNDSSAGFSTSDLNGDGVMEGMDYTTTKTLGESDVVTYNARYNQSTDIRKVMYKIWEISQFDQADKYISSSVMMNIVDVKDDLARGKGKRLMANLYSNLPGQILFILKILLTSFIIIFTSGIILSLGPKREN